MDSKKENKVLKERSPRRLAFAKFYLSEEIDGKPNPTFLKAIKSAIRAGYSKSYARNILQSIDKFKSTTVSEKLGETRQTLTKAFQDGGINSEWILDRVKELGMSKKQGTHLGRFFDSDQPDSHAVRVALEFIAKTQGLYYADETHPNDPHNLGGRSKEELIAIIIGGVAIKSSGGSRVKGKR